MSLLCDSTGGVPAADLMWTDHRGVVLDVGPGTKLPPDSNNRGRTSLTHTLIGVNRSYNQQLFNCTTTNDATRLKGVNRHCQIKLAVECEYSHHV